MHMDARISILGDWAMITRNTRDHPYQNPLDMFPSWRQFPIFNNSIHSDGLQHPSKLGTTSFVFHHFIFCLACIQESVCSASPLLVKILFVTWDILRPTKSFRESSHLCTKGPWTSAKLSPGPGIHRGLDKMRGINLRRWGKMKDTYSK